MTADLERRITALAKDRESGASELLPEVISVLHQALSSGGPILEIARAICRAQPSMAPVWNAALIACAPDGAVRLERFARRVERAPAAIARFAVDCFAASGQSPLRVVTISYSGSVHHVLAAVADRIPSVHVSCGEGRPALEGRRLAARLAALHIPVTVYGDAAIGHALAAADAVIVGADAVAPLWFLNKTGTQMLAASALQHGVPLYVVASREKFVGASVAEQLVVRDEAPSEIWAEPPAGVTVRNPYFERTSLELVTSVISDVGILGATMIPDVCAAQHDAATMQVLRDLLNA